MFTRIKAEREKRGMEQKELAARIGIAVPTLGNYEAGRREPPLDVLCAVADLFDISLDYRNCREKVDFAFFEVGEYTYIAKIKMAHSAF